MSKLRMTKAAKAIARKNLQRVESAAKPYWEMTADELRRATAEFDREFVGDTFRPPTAKQRAQLARAKRKRGVRALRRGRIRTH